MSTKPVVIEKNDLSVAWRSVLEALLKSKNGEICPLVLSITDFEETTNIRQILDKNLESHKMPKIETVAETIFPNSIYEYAKYDRSELYRVYKKNLIRIKKINSANKKGTYFSRLIAYGEDNNSINQLEIIISALNDKKSPRRSKLQAAIFDPSTDHINNPMQGFPCLQHVTFVKTKDGGLVLNAFYAMQYFYKRAYGNWLGLINLGKFIAKESGLKFERFNCFIGAEVLDNNIKKGDAKKLLEMTSL